MKEEKKRPTYFTIKDKNVLWFIPLSSKVDKYKKIINKKIEKYGSCDTIVIGEIMGREHAILIQNAFPTLEKYIDHVHTFNDVPVKVSNKLRDDILIKFKGLLRMKQKGINLFFTDIDRIKEIIMEEELETIK